MSTRRPAAEEHGRSRPSPTAPESKSRSANVWALLQADPRFREGMARARQQHDAGEFAPFEHQVPRPKA